MPVYLDKRILSSVNGILGLILCLCMFYVGYTRKTYAGFQQWTIAMFLNFSGQGYWNQIESYLRLPQGQIVSKREQVLSCSGSSYVSGPTLEALNQGPWKEEERIGVVGLPCQALALAKMRASSLETKTPIDRVDLVIGLFCTWALDISDRAYVMDKGAVVYEGPVETLRQDKGVLCEYLGI